MIEGKELQGLSLQVMSFGFRPVYSRSRYRWMCVFCLIPILDPKLRALSGLDQPVKERVINHEATQSLLQGLLPCLLKASPHTNERVSRI